jgi:predicted kinase
MKLTMTIGVPGAGKTTWALAQCAADPNTVRINKDDLRLELLGVRKGDHKEAPDVNRDEKQIILPERDLRISLALAAGKNVIIDDTNIAPKHHKRLQQLADQYGAEFEIKTFDTSLAECVKRNHIRPDGERVPEFVIHNMWKQLYGELPVPTFAPYEFTAGLPLAIICDIDGTAALFDKKDRNPYDASRCDEVDQPNVAVRAVLYVFQFLNDAIRRDMVNNGTSTELIYLSGRDDKFREPTQRFLEKYQFPVGQLHMRPTRDNRKDWIVKGELFDAHVRGKYNVLFILDDRDQVVNFWRSLGLTCFQVAPGAF